MIDGIHRARVVDVVGRYQRGVDRTWARSMKHLKHVARRIGFPIQYSIHPKVLRADVRRQILPFRMFGIGGWVERVGAYMAEATGCADAIRTDEILGVVVRWIGVI